MRLEYSPVSQSTRSVTKYRIGRNGKQQSGQRATVVHSVGEKAQFIRDSKSKLEDNNGDLNSKNNEKCLEKNIFLICRLIV
jgi:hypothetical protein